MLCKLLKAYAKMDALWLLRDTRYCLLQIVADIISVSSTLISMILLSNEFDGFGGLTHYQTMLMLGIAANVHGIYNLFFANYNNGMISRIIGRGQIDHYLIQPVPIWIQILTRGFAPFSGNAQFLLSFILIIFSLCKLQILSLVMVTQVLFISLLSTVTMTSFIYMVSTAAFYAPAAAEEISEPIETLFLNLSYFPILQMNIICRVLYTFIVPVASIAWLPTKILIEENNIIIMFFAITPCVSLALANICFRKGLNYYAKKGAGRYSGFGHR